MKMWKFGDIDAANLCLCLVEDSRYKTKKFSVNAIESCLY